MYIICQRILFKKGFIHEKILNEQCWAMLLTFLNIRSDTFDLLLLQFHLMWEGIFSLELSRYRYSIVTSWQLHWPHLKLTSNLQCNHWWVNAKGKDFYIAANVWVFPMYWVNCSDARDSWTMIGWLDEHWMECKGLKDGNESCTILIYCRNKSAEHKV